MNRDLEQLLHDALEARATQITPHDLETDREHDMRRRLAQTTPAHPRWRGVAMIGGGIAAAALVAGTVVMAGGLDRDRSAVAADPTLAVSPTSGGTQSGAPLGTAAPTTASSDPTDTESPMSRSQTQDRTSYVPAPPRDTEASRSMTTTEEPSAPTTQESSATTTQEPSTSTSSVDASTTRMTQASSPAHLSITPSVSVNSPQVTVSFSYSGRAHPYTSGGVDPTYTQITFGDGEQAGSDGGDVTCDSAAPTQPMNATFPRGTNTYANPGTYTITFTVGYCGDNGPTTTSTTRTVTIS